MFKIKFNGVIFSSDGFDIEIKIVVFLNSLDIIKEDNDEEIDEYCGTSNIQTENLLDYLGFFQNTCILDKNKSIIFALIWNGNTTFI